MNSAKGIDAIDNNKFSSPMLIMVMGLPGSGKTYFAKALAKRIGSLHFNSDRIRKELSAEPSYSPEEKTLIYKTMYSQVCEYLVQGEPVIVDATFSKKSYRSPYLNWAREHGIPVSIMMLQASEQITRERVGKKRPDSDADYFVYQSIKEKYEPLKEDHLHLRSDQDSLEEMTRKALDYMQKRSRAI